MERTWPTVQKMENETPGIQFKGKNLIFYIRFSRHPPPYISVF